MTTEIKYEQDIQGLKSSCLSFREVLAQSFAVIAPTTIPASNLSLFASSDCWSLLIMIGEFFLLVGIWCYAAYRLTTTKAIAELLTDYGNNLIPFILIALGIMILIDSQTLLNPSLTVIALLVSSLAFMSLSKSNQQFAEVTKSTPPLDK